MDGTYFYTIEGNTSGADGVVRNGGGVAKKKYSIAAYKGKVLFGHPKYDKAGADTSKPDVSKKQAIPKPASATPNLKKGSKGAQVKLLQQDLNYVLGSGLSEDGDFGSKTDSALRSFQKKYGLSVDGIYGGKSKAKMKALL